MDFEQSYFLLNKNTDKKRIIEVVFTDSGIFHLAKAMNNARKYVGQLKSSIFGASIQKKVLQFSSRQSCEESAQETLKPSSDVWPVKPRRKPLLKTPSIILDLPDIQNHLDCSSPLDWGALGYIATIYEKEVHFWHPEGKAIGATSTSRQVGNCLKWNRQGNLLAFATEYVHGKCAVWDIRSQKVIDASSCCFLFSLGEITAIEWTKSNDIITGCTNGHVRSWRLGIKKMRRSQIDSAISCIKLSSQEMYCAVVSSNNAFLKLLTWPKMDSHFDIHSQGIGEKISIDWHPWKDCLLAVGQSKSILIWNVNTLTVVGHISSHRVDAVAFNPISGELLVSIVSNCKTLTFLLELSTLQVPFNKRHVSMLLYKLFSSSVTFYLQCPRLGCSTLKYYSFLPRLIIQESDDMTLNDYVDYDDVTG
nr:unnamed protein product [Callosobruchus chinensis]